MCRYGNNTYKSHYACFNCQKTFKRRLLIDIDRNTIHTTKWENHPHKCPECGELTADMGLDFESPKKTDAKAWRHLKDLYQSGITFHSCGCSGPGYIPKDKKALLKFLTEKKQLYIDHRRFWSSRIDPAIDRKKNKDWNQNHEYLLGIPAEFESGTKKHRKIDLKKAVDYWTQKVEQVNNYLQKIEASPSHNSPKIS